MQAEVRDIFWSFWKFLGAVKPTIYFVGMIWIFDTRI